MPPEETIIYAFVCRDEGGTKFTVESPLKDIKELQAKGVFCPHCGKKWGTPESKVEWNPIYAGPRTSTARSQLAKENEEASRLARQAAADDIRHLNEVDPMAPDPKTGRTDPSIRISTVEKINRKAEELGVL